MSGKGIYRFSSGAKYEGQFKDNKFNGNGVLSCKEFTIKGDFLENKPCGMCTIDYASGEKYLGNMKDGMKDGSGVLIFQKDHPDCVKYDG